MSRRRFGSENLGNESDDQVGENPAIRKPTDPSKIQNLSPVPNVLIE
jgi:hypothetical protein